MIDNTKIEETLNSLVSAYDEDDADTNLKILYSKLALLEFCGWIEESLDDIIKSYLTRKSIDGHYLSYIEGVVSSNYGFEYNKNVRPMFCNTVGICGWKTIEGEIESEQLKMILNDMSSKRNKATHTHTVTQTYDSPTVIRNNYRKVKPIVIKMKTIMDSL